MSMLLDMVYYSNIDLEYLVLRPSKNETIAFDYDMNIELNNSRVVTKKSILNNRASFTAPEFSQLNKKYDLALAIGEPFLNGIFKTAVDTGVVRKIFQETAPIKGLTVNSLNIHFDQKSKVNFSSGVSSNGPRSIYERNRVVQDNTRVARTPIKLGRENAPLIPSQSYNTGTFTLVAGVEIDLSQIESKGLGSRFKNYIASTLESKRVWFPLELRFRPTIKVENGRSMLKLKFDKTCQGELLSNTYKYPKKDMYEMVEKGVLDTIKKDLFPALEQEISIDVTDYISVEGLKAKPSSVQFLKSGHLALLLDVQELALRDLVEFIGGN
jgi:hypothetical protein